LLYPTIGSKVRCRIKHAANHLGCNIEEARIAGLNPGWPVSPLSDGASNVARPASYGVAQRDEIGLGVAMNRIAAQALAVNGPHGDGSRHA
jgi:hypothetical protein